MDPGMRQGMARRHIISFPPAQKTEPLYVYDSATAAAAIALRRQAACVLEGKTELPLALPTHVVVFAPHGGPQVVAKMADNVQKPSKTSLKKKHFKK